MKYLADAIGDQAWMARAALRTAMEHGGGTLLSTRDERSKKVCGRFVIMGWLAAAVFALASCGTLALFHSDQMNQIAASLKTDPYNLNVEKLPRNSEVKPDDLATNSQLERYQVPIESGEDVYAYRIYYDKGKNCYWVTRTGGFAPVSEVYGPVELQPKH
jgi:hypothetical protein